MDYPENDLQLQDIPMRYAKVFRQEGTQETETYPSRNIEQTLPVIVI